MDDLARSELCFPQLANSSCRGPMRPRSEAVVFYALLSCIIAITVVLNLLVVVSISHFKRLHSPTNVILLSLAVSDLLVGLVVMPVESVRLIEACWLLGDLMCALSYIVGFTLTSASVGNMVLISIDRYVAICFPLQYPYKITNNRAAVSVSLCWACSLLYNGLILHDHLRRPDRYNSCYGECVVVISYASGTVDLVFTFVGPCSIIILLYMRVFTVAASQARAMHLQTAGTGQTVRVTAKKSERKAAKTLGIVIFVFLITFFPYYYPSLAGQEISNGTSYWKVVSWLLYFNSCLNPLIYAFFYSWFRKAMWFIVTLKIREQNSCQANIV